MTAPLRVAVCADFREEGWPSMDRVADRLLSALRHDHGAAIAAEAVCPPFTRRATRVAGGRLARNIDRGLNRLVDYPRHVGRLAGHFDIFHVVDHSYSQLVRCLPAHRTIVTCHDLDTFRSVLEPGGEVRSAPFRAMTRHILDGLRQAACVTCDTGAVRDEIVAREIVVPERVEVIPIGVGDEFAREPDAEADARAARLIGCGPGAMEILHVGSVAPRKRMDLVLRAVAALRRTVPDARLIRVGGPLTPALEALAGALGIHGAVTSLPQVDDRTLAAVYRRATVVLLPSDREGFGLPVVEALRCGTPVVARDLAVLREVGGPLAFFCRSDDPAEWAAATGAAAAEKADAAAVARGVAWAEKFTWTRFAALTAAVYGRVAQAAGVASATQSVICPA